MSGRRFVLPVVAVQLVRAVLPAVAVLLVVAVLLAGGFAAWQVAASRTCDRQAAQAAALAEDSVFATVPGRAVRYTETPCTENSGGSMVTAGARYEPDRALTVEDLADLADDTADPARWVLATRLRPTDPGSGGGALICYHSAAGADRRALRFAASGSTIVPGDLVLLWIEVGTSDGDADLC